MADLDIAFNLNNLKKAWIRLLKNPNYEYKNYFRESYKAYATTQEYLLEYISDKLRRGIYSPTEACKIYIPKKSGILRPITLLTVEDQIVYQAVVNIIADKLFPKVKKNYYKKVFGHLYTGKRNNYFYQKWQKGYRKFGEAIEKAYLDGFVFRAYFDLTACYDSIDHRVLDYFLNELGLDREFIVFLLNILSQWTKVDASQQIYQGHGIPQGPLSSGIISEVILSHFDNHAVSRSVRYFRYVDDIRLYSKNEHHLRYKLVELDLVSKKIGLFPQSSKINIQKIIDLSEELKTISNPSEPTARTSANQKAIRQRLTELSLNFKIKDETRFKWVLSQAKPTLILSRRLIRLVKAYPHLYVSIFRYFSRQEKFTDEIADELLELLKKEDLYNSFSANLINALKNKDLYNISSYTNQIKKVFNTMGRGIDLKLAAGSWLLTNNTLNFSETKNLAKQSSEWWVRAQVVKFLSKDFIGTPSYESLLNSLIKDVNSDVSIISAYVLSVAGLKLTTPRKGNNPAAQQMLKQFRLMNRTTLPCGIEEGFNRIFNKNLPSTSWRSILGAKHKAAERIIVRAIGYYRTDPTAWVLIIDTFNDLLLEALFNHDNSLGTYTVGNIGSILNNNSNFAIAYPEFYVLVKAIHEKRLEADLSHAQTKRTGKKTKPIKHSYIKKINYKLYNGYRELRIKW